MSDAHIEHNNERTSQDSDDYLHHQPKRDTFLPSEAARWPQLQRLQNALMRRRWYLLLMVLIAALALGVTMAVGIHTLTTQRGAHEPLAVRSFNGSEPREGILLYGGIKEWNIPDKTLSIRWSLFLCGESFGFAKGKCGNLDRDVSFFFNGDGISDQGQFNFSKAALNFTTDEVGYLDYGFEQTWDMELEQSTLSARVNRGGHEQDVLYPFDWYFMNFLATAVETVSNRTMPIVGTSIFTLQFGSWVSQPNQATRLAASIYLKRHLVVQFSTMLIVILNWMVALSLLYMTILHVFAFREFPEGMDSVALPLAGLFALPTVRGVFPGEPPLGCVIDFVGIIPNLAIIALCAVTLLYVRLHRQSRIHGAPDRVHGKGYAKDFERLKKTSTWNFGRVYARRG